MRTEGRPTHTCRWVAGRTTDSGGERGKDVCGLETDLQACRHSGGHGAGRRGCGCGGGGGVQHGRRDTRKANGQAGGRRGRPASDRQDCVDAKLIRVEKRTQLWQCRQVAKLDLAQPLRWLRSFQLHSTLPETIMLRFNPTPLCRRQPTAIMLKALSHQALKAVPRPCLCLSVPRYTHSMQTSFTGLPSY